MFNEAECLRRLELMRAPRTILFASLLLVSFTTAMPALRAAPVATDANSIISDNSDSIVYIEATDSSGGVVDTGTGFIVSHDGFVVTAAHIKVAANQSLWAVIGQRQGVRFKLNFRDSDDHDDVALWQLPASSSCRRAVTISTTAVKVLDPVMALGFPGNQDMAPAKVDITNLSSPVGFYKVNGMLQPGTSGSPVFDESGKVIGVVEGGVLSGSDDNDVVPIAPVLALLQKHGVQASLGTAAAFDTACYAICRVPSNGLESWGVSRPWSAHSGWESGGHDGATECNGLVAATVVNTPGSEIMLAPGTAGISQQSKKDVLGHVEYQYFCSGTLEANPVYKQARSEECGLR